MRVFELGELGLPVGQAFHWSRQQPETHRGPVEVVFHVALELRLKDAPFTGRPAAKLVAFPVTQERVLVSGRVCRRSRIQVDAQQDLQLRNIPLIGMIQHRIKIDIIEVARDHAVCPSEARGGAEWGEKGQRYSAERKGWELVTTSGSNGH